MRIEVGPHTSRLLDDPGPQLQEQLREALSYELPGAEFTKNKFTRVGGKMKYNPRYQANTRKYLYDKRTDRFPTGLLDRVKALVGPVTISEPIRPSPMAYYLADQNRSPRYYQVEAWQQAISSPRQRGVIILPTGTGKTLLCSMLTSSYPIDTVLITVPNLNLLNQSRDEMEKILGIPVGILGDDQCDLRRVTVATIQSLMSKQDDPAVKPFLKSCTVWISDECHGTAADSYLDLSKLLVNTNVRFGVTATWMREDNKDLLMEGVLGSVIYKYDIKKAMSDGYLCPVTIKLRHVAHSKIDTKPKPKYKQVYKQAITDNQLRSEMIIAQDIQELIDTGRTPCLVIVDEIAHGQALSKLLGAPFISGQEKKRDSRKQILDDFESGKTPVLIGSSVMNVGVDVPTIKSMVNAAGGKSLTLLLQRIGRALRIHPSKSEVLYVDYLDHQPLYIEEHANLRKFFYNQYFNNVQEITHEPL